MDGYVFISSTDNERIKLYRRLCTDRRARKKEGLFPIEGARLVCDAAAEAARLRCVFVTEDAEQKYSEAMELLTERYDSRIFYRISAELAAAISETGTPQGVFAVCEAPALDKSLVYGKIKKGSRLLILDNIQDPGNMGTMLRTADACGIEAVILCNCCDYRNPKVIRSAMGSLMRVPVVEDAFENAVKSVQTAGIPVFAAVIGGGTSLTDCDFAGGGAVIIGNEGNGIPDDHADLADHRLTIKMHGTINSLNAAMAAGIIMWELSK